MTKIKLGDKVKDTITGFEGIATSQIKFLNGCVQIGIQPYGLTKDGDVKEQHFVDSQQIEVIKPPKPEKPKKEKKAKKPPGGGFRQYPKLPKTYS